MQPPPLNLAPVNQIITVVQDKDFSFEAMVSSKEFYAPWRFGARTTSFFCITYAPPEPCSRAGLHSHGLS